MADNDYQFRHGGVELSKKTKTTRRMKKDERQSSQDCVTLDVNTKAQANGGPRDVRPEWKKRKEGVMHV